MPANLELPPPPPPGCSHWSRLPEEGGPPRVGYPRKLLLQLLLLLLLPLRPSCTRSLSSRRSLKELLGLLGIGCFFGVPRLCSVSAIPELWLFTIRASSSRPLEATDEILALARSSSATARWGWLPLSG